MTETLDNIAARHAEVLHSLGWPCHRSERKIVVFEVHELRFVLRLYEDDPEYLHIDVLHRMPDWVDPDYLAGACVEAGRKMKVGKARAHGLDLVVSVGQIMAGPDELPDRDLLGEVLPRLVSILMDTTNFVYVNAAFKGIVATCEPQTLHDTPPADSD